MSQRNGETNFMSIEDEMRFFLHTKQVNIGKCLFNKMNISQKFHMRRNELHCQYAMVYLEIQTRNILITNKDGFDTMDTPLKKVH